MKVTVDTSELDQLTARLGDVPRNAWPLIHKAVEVNARNIKDAWAENLGGKSNPGSAFKHIGSSVDYDMGVAGGMLSAAAGVASGVEAVIGPNLARRQGAMAGWFEEGMRNIPALHAGNDALRRNEADLVRGLELAAEQALRESL